MAAPTRDLSVLYIGGTGTISASCVRRSVAAGMSVSVLNRGQNVKHRSLPESVTWLQADIGDAASVRKAIGDQEFGAVANFLSFNAADAAEAVGIFRGRTRQYLHISTASLYRKPVLQWPIVESNLRQNPFVSYSREKIAAEDELMRACVTTGFPVTIVRPSHTYDEANPPIPGDWTVIDRIARGAEVIAPGDGTSLWTLTHADDFAQGLVGLLGNPRAIGEVFHITSDDVYTWDQIYSIVARRPGGRAADRAHPVGGHPGRRAGLVLVRADPRRPVAQRGLRQLQGPAVRAGLRPAAHVPRDGAGDDRLAGRARRAVPARARHGRDHGPPRRRLPLGPGDLHRPGRRGPGPRCGRTA